VYWGWFYVKPLNINNIAKEALMALTSPGVEISVIDESNYLPSATNTVPYVLIATAQNKVSGSGEGVAVGTIKANANKIYLITSQRDLSATFGNPFFYKTTTGTPINGYELNEYGLLAAYSALGLTNQCYVQRADIDLAELTASLSRPTGEPDNGTYWLDTANTSWGVFEWNQTTTAFTRKVPLVLTSPEQIESSPSTVPLQSVGSIGDYAINAVNVNNPMYYKNSVNEWVLVGGDAWKLSWPTIQGSQAPSTLTAGGVLSVNGTAFTIPTAPSNTIDNLVAQVNAASIIGVAAANVGGRFTLYGDSSATSDGSTADGGVITIENVVGTPLGELGIVERSFYTPTLQQSPNFQVPRWRLTDSFPRPNGSIWVKTTQTNQGALLLVRRYDTTLGEFVTQSCPLYANDQSANNALDPAGGGRNILAGSTYAQYDVDQNDTATIALFERRATGVMNATGSVADPTFIINSAFILSASAAGSNTLSTPVTVTLLGSTVSDFVSAISAAAVPFVSASVNAAGQIVMTHSQGGVILVSNIVGTPLEDAGLDTAGRPAPGGEIILSNWEPLVYTASTGAPDQDPAAGRLWYYSDSTVVDIMIKGDTEWQGYQTVTNDVRGYDLTLTNATGPIISPTPPATQTDEAQSPLVYGDLWIDSSDLENYPRIFRWENADGTDEWVPIDNADQTTENGVLFADARWAPNGSTDPVSDPLPTIQSLLVSSYLDLDAPQAQLYPSGILLFNLRRSGFNVKSFQPNYFNASRFPDSVLPQVRSTWLTASGLRNDGSPYMGRQAQRALVVAALKSGVDSSTAIREEQNQFSLLSCPQYPELVPNLIALNNERDNTGFVVGDTPLRLPPNGTDIVAWSTNNTGSGTVTGDGLILGDRYAAAFYPSCQTTDLTGSTVVQPPSHMMIRTIIQNDNVAFPWFAPAGTRRGVIDNAISIGYVNAATGEFQQLGVNQGLRDILYQRNINPITFIPGVGITNFGNKTTTLTTSALDRINVARLIAFMRGRLEVIAKQYLFEPNDQITRNDIKLQIENLCIDLVAKRGIYDFLVQCDSQNNTPARIDRNELWVDIAIEPVKSVEFIYIPLRIKNTGEISSGNVASSQAV
jgi:hypothetical protein